MVIVEAVRVALVVVKEEEEVVGVTAIRVVVEVERAVMDRTERAVTVGTITVHVMIEVERVVAVWCNHHSQWWSGQCLASPPFTWWLRQRGRWWASLPFKWWSRWRG